MKNHISTKSISSSTNTTHTLDAREGDTALRIVDTVNNTIHFRSAWHGTGVLPDREEEQAVSIVDSGFADLERTVLHLGGEGTEKGTWTVNAMGSTER